MRGNIVAAKKVQRHAGAVCSAFVFLLVCGFCIPSPQAECWITVDGVQRQTTLETLRTQQATAEVAQSLGFSGSWDGSCYTYSYDYGVPGMFENSGSYSACIGGTWSEYFVRYRDPVCFNGCHFGGTWDVVCECLQDSDCDDGAFCNGAETCAETACVAGSPPCSEAQVCDEGNEQCVECMSSADCDDGKLCKTSSGVCVECLAQGDCFEGYKCVEGLCMLTPHPGQWTWMSGSNTTNQAGTYGTKGTPDPANIPGARSFSASWTDNDGNFWLLGGMGWDSTSPGTGIFNDLWRYEPDNGFWTWMSGAKTTNQLGVYGTKGVPSSANEPGARVSSNSWTDNVGYLWLFGGEGPNGVYFNDLWSYEPDTSEWTWMSGANTINQTGSYGTKGVPAADNVPGGRAASISWKDSNGNIWLFGGFRPASAVYFNDLWRYDPATNQWAWMGGANTINQRGSYGTKGVPDTANVPGARGGSISWKDSDGNFWLFGGQGYGITTSRGYLNDLWRYDPETNQWAWMGGANTINQAGTYGTKGVPDGANVPGARYMSISWADSSGNLWLFGGSTSTGDLSDLWRYDPDTNQWTWMSGAKTIYQVGTYGTKGVPDAANVPGARLVGASWRDSNGNLLLFGGSSFPDIFNDLWRYEVPECVIGDDCDEGYECVEGVCEIIDDPPALTAAPFVAAGTWPVLPASQESPMYLDQNYSVLWSFSDDFASCSEDCTHSAEYQAVGGTGWTTLPVMANAAKGFAYVTLPIESLQNATTYALRYSVTDCASQTTQSAVYYFRVAVTDAPPVITSGPFLAAGAWPVLATSSSRATVLDQNEYVLWTFSDDYAFCCGLCTYRARYRKVGDTAWTWIAVSADPTGKKYAYTELPVESLGAGTYQFYFDVRDCAGQLTKASKIYYFKVE